jgi:hypothetical protein
MLIRNLHLVQDFGRSKFATVARKQHQGSGEDEEFCTTWITHVS